MGKLISSIIFETRMNKGLSKAKMGELLGASGQLIGKYEDGKMEPKIEFRKKFQEIFEVDLINIETNGTEPPPRPEPGKRRIPVIGDAAAGDLEINVHDNSQEMDYIDVGELLSDSEAAFTVYGNSMLPAYPPGCLIGIKRNMDGFIQPGETYMLLTKSTRLFKRLFYNKDKTAYVCRSENQIKYESGEMAGDPCYPMFEVPFSAVISVFDITGMIKRNRNSQIMQRQK